MAIQDPSVTSKRQRSKEYKSRPFFRLLFNKKEPGEGSGAASTYHRKTYFQIFWPSSFLYQKQKARGLHSMSAKIALAALKGKRTQRTSSKSTHQPKEESKKTISRFHFKKNPDQVYNNSALEAQSWNARGLVDGEPYGPPIDHTTGR